MTIHQQKQIEIINQIEGQIRTDSLKASAVIPVENFDEDTRICLTSVHFPHRSFVNSIYTSITKPLQKLFSKAYYYSPSSLHLTIKNIRVINDPPHFTDHDVTTAKKVCEKVVPSHKQFSVYPYRLLLFNNNLALMSTTDEELDTIILDLDRELNKAHISDDKQYVNFRYFFSNMTLARFNTHPPQEFISKVVALSSTLKIPVYSIDSVSLISGNAVMKKLNIHDKWMLTH